MQELVGIVRYLINHLNLYYNMRYALGHAFNLRDLFMNFKKGKLKITCAECLRLNKERHREDFAQMLFKESVKMVLEDIIENGDVFELPTGKRKVWLRIKRFTGADFLKGRKQGRWQNVDLLESNFSGHQMVFEYETRAITKTKPVYLDPKRRDRIIEKTNQGIIYY